MKTTTSLKIAGAVLASALSIMAVRADLAINENVSLLGYAAGSIQYNKIQDQDTETTMDIDAVKIGVALNFEPISANLSIYTGAADGPSDLRLLDAHATYEFGRGLSASAGRFVTYLGYEAFDLTDNTFITYGTAGFGGFAGIFPSYHEGAKIEYVNGKSTLGLAIVDSVYNLGDEFYRGDGDVRDGFGVEGNFTHTEENWTLGLTLAYQYGKNGYQDIGGQDPYLNDPEVLTADIWLERNFGDTTIAAEIALKRDDSKIMDAKNTLYVALQARQDLSDKISVAGRLSHGNEKDFGNFWKLSVMPVGYEISNNFSIRSEIGYTRYSKSIHNAINPGTGVNYPKHELFAGVQAVFKF